MASDERTGVSVFDRSGQGKGEGLKLFQIPGVGREQVDVGGLRQGDVLLDTGKPSPAQQREG